MWSHFTDFSHKLSTGSFISQAHLGVSQRGLGGACRTPWKSRNSDSNCQLLCQWLCYLVPHHLPLLSWEMFFILYLRLMSYSEAFSLVEQHFAFDCWTLQILNLETILIPFRLKNSQYFPIQSVSGLGFSTLMEVFKKNQKTPTFKQFSRFCKTASIPIFKMFFEKQLLTI